MPLFFSPAPILIGKIAEEALLDSAELCHLLICQIMCSKNTKMRTAMHTAMSTVMRARVVPGPN